MPVRPTSQRAEQRNPLPGFASATARIAHRFSPRAAPALPQQAHRIDAQMRNASDLAISPRTLIVALIVLAVLPNLSLAAYLWLPALQGSAPPVGEPQAKSASLAAMAPDDDASPATPPKPRPVLTAPATLEANASVDTPLPITLDGTDGIPARSIVAISGLPEGATLSNGRPYGATGWNLKPDEIGDVQLHVPGIVGGETKLAIALVAPQGDIIASAETVLKMTAAPQGTSGPQVPPEPDVAPVASVTAVAATLPDRSGELAPGPLADDTAASAPDKEPAARPDTAPAPTAFAETADAEAKLEPAKTEDADGNDPAPATSGAAKPMTLASADPAADDEDGPTFVPAMYVNLRKDPNSSSPVLGIVPKGTKLAVLGRKRGWVQVTNPESSEKGWIYASHLRRAQRSAKASDDDDGTFWSRMSNWIGGSPPPDTQAH